MRRVIHFPAHRIGDHRAGGVGLQQCSECIDLLIVRIQPGGVIAYIDYHGHTFVNGFNYRIGRCDDYSARFDHLALVVLPVFPQPCQAEQDGFIITLLFQGNGKGLLVMILGVPFIEAADRDQATSTFKGRTKGRFAGDCFGPGIDHTVVGLFIFRPAGYQAPMEIADDAFIAIQCAHSEDIL